MLHYGKREAKGRQSEPTGASGLSGYSVTAGLNAREGTTSRPKTLRKSKESYGSLDDGTGGCPRGSEESLASLGKHVFKEALDIIRCSSIAELGESTDLLISADCGSNSASITEPDASSPADKPNDGAIEKDHSSLKYEQLLESAVLALKNDFVSGAKELADVALEHLAVLFGAAGNIAKSRNELWKVGVQAAKQLSEARPSMGAAVTMALLSALDQIENEWNRMQKEYSRGPQSRPGSETVPQRLAEAARDLIEQHILVARKHSHGMSEGFDHWMQEFNQELPLAEKNHIHILTLSNSSTIRNAILSQLSQREDLHLHLDILESRPRFEGADMAAKILASVHNSNQQKSRLHIRILPDCAVVTAARTAHVVLLGADRISPAGDVSNKIGSLAAVACARQVNPRAKVVVLSDEDKIALPGVEEGHVETHPDEEMTEAWGKETREVLGRENVEVFGEWFEWVPAQFVDAYIMGGRAVGREDIKRTAEGRVEMRDRIFGKVEG
ncbi:nagb/rpia/CoA transferase-like protein [Trematosphaeria pertusa]|uniref:Nagb/rpia/CoA transferase-like protein n=1 Tax=Trematosphaeria pertusa TaxID=390896 RepID=A0A6A6I0V7_9PLEO|nr:nagb/rpia/CoA transferase-like protein [Trematosphaeria pertusa]KAF2243907.1 nagb/rpia/CoA transferase-like protein [Trematosphaeria pertusa]